VLAEERVLRWLALSLTSGLGPTRVRRLIEAFGNVEAVFRASLTELEATGLPAASAQSLATGKSMELAQQEWSDTTEFGATLMCPDDDDYPKRINEIYDPPLVLTVLGERSALAQPGIAVVGTRHPTPYGLGMAERLAQDLAAHGLAILSGMARGVDAAAHRGALASKGVTVGVLGTGIDVIYPKENKRLAEQILAAKGALITEFPFGTFAAPQNFPIRNRIISGMSVGVLVIEAAEYSGTRITARCALEQGREVFAVPGNVTNKNAWGPNTLIKQGAKLTATWEDVWEELPTAIRLQLEEALHVTNPPQTASLFPTEAEPGLPPHESRIMSLLRPDESTHIDSLVEQLEPELSSSEIFAALFELELAGKVRQLPGKNFVKVF
jgi:DNA processing protein